MSNRSNINLVGNSTTAENIPTDGNGIGVFAYKNFGNNLRFKKLCGVGKLSVTSGATSGDTIIISGATDFSGITNSCNGLTDDGKTVCLGGTLTGNTTISGAHTLALSSLTAFNASATNIGLTGIVTATGAVIGTSTLNISGATLLGSTLGVDSVVTFNSVAAGTTANPIMVLDSGVVKCVSASSYDVTANNGLTVVVIILFLVVL